MNTNKRSRYLAAAISAVLSFAAAAAHASPQNGSVTAGTATINQPNANETTITQTSNSVSIDWDSFDLDTTDSVVFAQPSANSVALNRILDANPSDIRGSISANGRIFLMNANGIIFGSTATVNVGALVATSLDLASADDINEIYTFDAADQRGDVVNQGDITAGSVALFGGSVLNNGLIVANLGSISLGAGRAATVSFDAGGLINFQVDTALTTDDSGASALVDNAGTLQAEGGQVLLTSRQATSIVANAVNNGGTIIATGITTDGGTIRLVGDGGTVANSGTLDVAGSGGNAAGSVQIDGRSVSLGAGTSVNVAGATAGSLQIDSDQAINAAGTLAIDGTTTLSAAGAIVFGATTAGTLNATAGGTITQNSSGITAGAASFTTLNNAGAAITLGANANSFGSIGASVRNAGDTANAAAGITIRENNATTLSGNLRTAAGQTVSVDSAGAITQSNAITAAGNVTLTGTSTTLSLNNNFSGTVGFSGGSASLTNAAATTLGTTNVSAGLTVSSTGGQLTQAGTVSAGSVTLSSNNNVVLNNTLSSTGALSVTAGGNITQTGGTVAATGAATFTGGNAGSIDVARVGNNFGGTVDLAASGGGTLLNVALRDASALTLQALTVSGDLDVTASGITQSGAVNATGDATLTSTSGATVLNTLNAATLTVNSAGTVTQSGGLTVSGLTQINASGQAVTLTGSNTMSGGIEVAAASASIANTGTTLLRASTVTNALDVNSSGTLAQAGVVDAGSLTLTSGANVVLGEDVTTGALTVTAATDISQNIGTVIDASGAASFTAGNARSITVDQSGNDFGGTVTFAASTGQLQNVSVRDTSAFDLQALSVTGNLNVQAAAIDQVGAVSAGATTLTSAGTLELGTLTASSLTANAGGAVTQTGALNVAGITQFNAAGQTVTLGQSNALSGGVGFDSGAVQLTTSGAVELRASTITGTFEVNANGAITQSDAISATGATTLNAGTQSVVLTQANSFSGGIGVTAADAQITNSGATQLRTSSVTNALNVTSSGALSQSGIVTAGSTTLTSSGSSVTLGNDLSSGALTVNAGTDVSQTGGVINASGAADFTAGNARSISVNRNNTFGDTIDFSAGSGTLQSIAVTDTSAIELQQIVVTNELTVTSTGGDITQSGVLSAGGISTFTASGRNVTLTNPGNTLSGPVRFTASTASLTNSGATNIGASTLTTSLSVDSTGSLTQSGAVNVVGGTTTLNSDAGVALNTINTGSLTIDAGGTVAQTGVLTVTGSTAINAAGQTVNLSSANALTGGVTVTASNASLTNSLATTIAGATVDNNLTVNSTGAITQDSAISAGGTMALSSGAGIALNTSNVGALTVNAGGAVTQSNALTVAGTTTIVATGQDVTLGLNNALSGGIAVTAANASITNSVAATLLASTLSDSLSVSSASAITQTGALDVGDTTTLSGVSVALNTIDTTTLNVTAVNGITQSGTLAATGSTALSAGTTMDLNTIDTGTLSATAGGAITQTGTFTVDTSTTLNAASLNLGTINTGSFNATATGAIAQSGTLTAGGATVLNAGANAAVGTIAANTLDISAGGTITQAGVFTVTNAATLNAAELNLRDVNSGSLNATTTGAIAQSGTLTSGGATVLDAGTTVAVDTIYADALDITAGDTITQSGTFTVVNATTLNGNAIDLGDINSGSLNATATGAIAQSGALTVGASTTLNAGSAIALNTIDTGTLNVTAGGATTQSGAITARDDATISAAGQDVTLNNVSNDFRGGIALNGATVSITDSGPVSLLASNVTGNLMVNSLVGGIGQSGALSVGGTSTFTAAAGESVTLADAANTFGNTVSFGSSGALNSVTVTSASNLDLGALIVSGGLNVNSAGSLSQSGTLLIGGAANLVAGGSIALGSANQFGAVNASSQGPLSITQGAGNLSLRQVSSDGGIRLEATNGSIVDDLSDASASLIASSTGIELRARDTIGTVTDLRTRQGTAIAVNPGTGTLSAHVTSATGQINLALASGSNPSAAPASITSGGNGRLLIQSGGNLSLDAFDSAVAGFSEAGFSADGTLIMPGAQGDLIAGPLATLYLRGGSDIARVDRTFALNADTLVFESGGQGGSVTLNTDAGLLDASLGGTGNLTVADANDLTLGTITAGGNVSITATNIGDDGDTSGVTRVNAGNVLLTASGHIGSATNRIDTTGNGVAVQAGSGSVFLSHAGDLQVGGAAAGSIDIEAASGNITVASTLQASGPLALTAGATAQAGNIVLSGVASSGSTATLSALGGGTITDSDDASPHLSAETLTLSATAIGDQANRLSIGGGSVGATADTIYLQAASALQVRSISGQTVAIGANGALTDDADNSTRVAAQTLTLSGASIGAAGNEVDTDAAVLNANTTAGGIFVSDQGDVQLATISSAGAGNDISITASGAITGDGATRIAGSQLSLSGSSIGAPGAELNTQVSSLTATSTSGVYVNEGDDLQLNTISGTDVSITASGALTDDSNDSTRVAANNVRLSGTRIGAADNRIDTAAGSLSLVASNGGIYFAEQDDVALAEARSSGTGNTVDGQTGGNGSMTVQTLVTQGGAVNLAAGGTGSLTVTGAIESNNGVVNLTSGNALALPGLDTGSGAVVLRTVNDLNVGTITASSVSITSDTGNVSLGTINATGGTVTVAANNGTITDGTDTSVTAGQATLSARSIGGPDQALDVEVDNLTATATGGGIFINDGGSLTLGTISATGEISLATTGALTQTAGINSSGSDITLIGGNISMQAGTTTVSGGGNIAYVANSGDVQLSVIDASSGRALVMGAGNVYSTLSANAGVNNLTAAAIEIRAGGLNGAAGEIGTFDAPIAIATAGGGGAQSVYLIVPAVSGIQTTTPNINYAGPSGSLLLKGYTGTAGVLLFDMSSTFSPETILSGDETIVPLRNGRVAVNSDSLAAAKQALSSGVITRVNVDWAAFDPNVSLFGTLDPSLRLPADQVDEAAPAATLIPEGTMLLVSRDGWRLKHL